MADYDQNAADDVRAALAQLADATPAEPQHDAAEGAPPPVDQAPSTERWQPSYTEETSKERARDSHGRFARANQKPSQEDAAKADVVRSIAQLKGEPVAPEPPPEPVDVDAPPKRWPREARALWAQLPDNLRGPLARQLAADETNLGKAFDLVNQRQGALQTFQAIDAALAPHRQSYSNYGFKDDAAAVTALMASHHALMTDPVGSIAYLYQNAPPAAQQQLRAMLAGQAPQQQHYSPQPDITSVVRNEIGLAQAASEIDQFAQNPDYPHFGQVRGLMSQLLQGGHCRTLEEAYTAAVMADPQLRAQHFAQLEARDAAKRSRSVAAKRAASGASLHGAPHGATAPARHSNGKFANAHDDAVADVRASIESLR